MWRIRLRHGDNSSTRTFAHDDDLPRLPLPTLDESCTRFIEWCAPLLTAEELISTRTAVGDFSRPGGPGERLHAALEEFDASHGVHSWLDEYWPDQYLSRRESVVINANFFALLRDTDERQVDRAASLIAAAAHYKKRLDDERVPPTTQRGVPQSMVQYKSLFSTTRIPGPTVDSIRSPYGGDWPGPSPARHVVVFFRGNMFRLDVLDRDGQTYPVDTLAAGIRTVMSFGAVPAVPGTSIGHLTTKSRADWAADRQALLTLGAGNTGAPTNVEAFNTVETALLCLCLEDFAPADTQAACDALLHGDSGNRWFDKALSLIVFADGRAGVNCEHSRLDGVTVLTFLDALLDTPAGDPARPRGGFPGEVPAVAAVEFVLDDALRASVLDAATSFAKTAADTAGAIVCVDDFGSDQAKRLQISPDAFVQMAFQLTHSRVKGRVASTYESIAMRHFRRGRTEAMRVVTPQVVRFVAAMDDPTADAEAKRAAFRTAADQHAVRAKQCQTGRAPERHLAELQRIQQRRGAALGVRETPAIFQSPGWLALRDEYLSTSTVPAVHVPLIGFGPTGPHCIGIAYRLTSQRLSLYLSASRAEADPLPEFAQQLRAAVHELEDLLQGEETDGKTASR
jgi:carnitine O-acetyltransferase